MKSPLKRDDGYAAKPADEQPPVMRFHGRQRKVRDVVVRKYDVRVDLTGELTETRPQDEANRRPAVTRRADSPGRFLNGGPPRARTEAIRGGPRHRRSVGV